MNRNRLNIFVKSMMTLDFVVYLIFWFIVGLIIGTIVAVTTPVIAETLNIPDEPGQEKVLERFINPSIGAFLIVYDMDGDGMGDYMTQRDITPDFTLIAKYPSYYAVDLNGDGTVDSETELFIDINRDGLNGNEILYVKWLEEQEGVEG